MVDLTRQCLCLNPRCIRRYQKKLKEFSIKTKNIKKRHEIKHASPAIVKLDKSTVDRLHNRDILANNRRFTWAFLIYKSVRPLHRTLRSLSIICLLLKSRSALGLLLASLGSALGQVWVRLSRSVENGQRKHIQGLVGFTFYNVQSGRYICTKLLSLRMYLSSSIFQS